MYYYRLKHACRRVGPEGTRLDLPSFLRKEMCLTNDTRAVYYYCLKRACKHVGPEGTRLDLPFLLRKRIAYAGEEKRVCIQP